MKPINLNGQTNKAVFYALLTAGVILFVSCAGDKKTASDKPNTGSETPAKPDENESVSVSATRKNFVQSFANNPMTSHTVNKSKADQVAAKLESGMQGSKEKDKRGLEGLVSARRLAGKPLDEVINTAKHIAEIEMRRSVDKDISDDLKLEIAIAAMQNGKYALADFYLDQLVSKSKDASAKAGALNALGVIATRQDRIPEAVSLFKEALKVNSGYKAAKLNLGFLALGGGDFSLAKRMLSDMQGDWFVDSGLLIVARLENDSSRTDSLCAKVLGKKPDHKPTLFNCGVFEWQNKRNAEKAKEYLTKSVKVQGGQGSWDEKAYRLIGNIDTEKQMDLIKKRDEDERRKAAEQAKKDAAGVKGGQDAQKGTAPAPAQPAPK